VDPYLKKETAATTFGRIVRAVKLKRSGIFFFQKVGFAFAVKIQNKNTNYWNCLLFFSVVSYVMAEAESAKNIKPRDNAQRPKKQNRTPSQNHVFRKRQPQKPEVGENVIYVSTKTSIKGLLERCTKLINNNEDEIIIYCLGAAIQRGILLTLQLCEAHVAYQYHTNTFSTTLIDDLEPAADDADFEMQKRFNSALRIRIYRCDPLESVAQTSEHKETK